MTAIILTSRLFILNTVIVSAFVADPNRKCYLPPPPHHKHHRHVFLHQRTKTNIPSLHSSASDVDLRAEQELNQSKTPAVTATPIQFLSTEEHDHINQLVHKRSEARWKGDYKEADEIREAIEKTRVIIPWSRILQSMKDSDSFRALNTQQQDVDLEYEVIVTDFPRSQGGESEWELMPIGNPWIDNAQKEDNVLHLAHAALGMAVSASERGANADEEILKGLINRAEDRLQTLEQRKSLSMFFPGAAAAAGELHGRKAADAILWFALAGVVSGEHKNLYNDLVDIATEELLRFGMNSSCRAKDVLHIVERVAMAGIVSESSKRLYSVAADCLEAKMKSACSQEKSEDEILTDEEGGSIDYGNIIQSLRDSSFGLHSDRSLLGLWRFSTRQRKQRAFFQNAARHFDGTFREGNTTTAQLEAKSVISDQYDWSAMFKDPSRPLVVDIGCGMGVSLLGLASSHNSDGHSPTADSEIQIDWNECNFIGVDLSRLTIRYAQGVCERWRLGGGNLNFVVDSAEECLKRISETYPGNVAMVMLQFPTPYRFQNATDDEDADGCDSGDGSTPSVARKGFNSQLPEGAASDDFMVTEKLLSRIYEVLSKYNGQLLVQSNCEDVAVHMRNVATNTGGFQSVAFSDPVVSLGAVTQRAQNWVAMGGERAIGKCWSADPLLPSGGRTETEVACSLDSKPVHRCLLNAY